MIMITYIISTAVCKIFRILIQVEDRAINSARSRMNFTTLLSSLTTALVKCRGVFRPRQTRQLPRAVDLKGRLLSCQSY